MNEDAKIDSQNELLAQTISHAEKQEESERELVDVEVFFALSNDLLAIAGADGFFHRLNHAWETTTGYTIEELLAKPFIEFVHPDDRENTLDVSQKNFAGEEIKGFENRYICKDGTIKWLLWNSVASDKSKLVYSVAHDITTRKKTESELLALSLALANALEGIAQIDAIGEFTSVNKAFAQQLGYSDDELIGVHWQNIVAPSSSSALHNAFNRMQRIGKTSFEAQGLRKNGTTFFAEVTIVKALDDTGQDCGHHCFMKDISEPKEAYRHLAQSEARFRSLSSQLPGVVYQFVVTKTGERYFPYISDSCKTITGYEAREIQADPRLSFAMVHRDDLAGLKAKVLEAIKSQTPYSFEGRILTKQGETKWIQASCSSEVLPTKDILWNCILMDITKLKQADERIRQLNDDLALKVASLSDVNEELNLLTRKLELAYDHALEAARLKSEFVANISHEVRTPLSAVIGMTDLLLDTPLTLEQQDFARIVKESAKALLTIINDILDFSKMEAGKMELETIEFNLLELVEGCVELLSSTARDKGLALFTFVDPKIPKIVQGDPVRLRQVLLNLTSNAIKFTSSGKVIVEAQTIKPALDGEVKLRFSVTDTGCGLTKEARALLFQPFIQADGSTTRKYGGTGLGLSISKRLVEMMNGSIGVESEFGKGSKFFFSASLQCGNTEAPLLDPEIKLALQNKRILLMDENKCLSLVAKPYLEASDVITTAACDPQTVVFMLKRALLQNIPFHLLIVDYEKHFDAKNSFVLNAAISSANDSKTPMIFLINFDEEDQIAKFSKKGSSAAYLIKPIRQNSFYRLVAKMLSQPTYFSEHPSFKSKTEELKKFSIEEEPHERSGDEVNSNGSEKIETEMGKKIVFVESQVAELETNKKQRTHALVMGKRIKILLAEDNITMQKLGVQQLSKLGFDVTAVGNGSDILKALKNENFCMILMDCQMPIIDGFETTKIIRQNEKTTGEHIPIVALTASAMDGDKEICYAAGMDDYLSKPVDQQQLKLIIQKWCEKKNEQSQSPDLKDIEPILQIDGAKDNSADNPFDIQQLILLYGGENIAEILRSFVSEGREILSQIQKSLSKKDIESLTAEAHSLKGMAMVLTAHQMAEVSLALEQAAKNAAFEKVASHLSILEQSLLSAQAFIASVVDETEKNSLNSNLQAENLQV